MGRRKKRDIVGELALAREMREKFADDPKFVLRHRLESDIWWLERMMMEKLDKRRPNVAWLGQRLMWRRKLADKYWEASDGRGLYAEDHHFF